MHFQKIRALVMSYRCVCVVGGEFTVHVLLTTIFLSVCLSHLLLLSCELFLPVSPVFAMCSKGSRFYSHACLTACLPHYVTTGNICARYTADFASSSPPQYRVPLLNEKEAIFLDIL
jgi:hypothetical protein